MTEETVTDPNDLTPLVLPDSSADPSSNGEMQRNGNTVLIYTGGSARNVTDIADGKLRAKNTGWAPDFGR